MSKRLCEMMGGTMWAESEPGKGSAFHFSVRAAPAVGAAPRPVAAELRRKRLLIVDDNAANREAVASHARSWGMVPRDTGSPAQALGWIRRGDPLDVAILDMQMPEMDGLTLACEIRRWLDRDALPLVISPRSQGGLRMTRREASCSRPYEADQRVAAARRRRGRRGCTDRRRAGGADARARSACGGGRAAHPARGGRRGQPAAGPPAAGELGSGAEVVVNGGEALEELRSRPYDVVLTDVEMPEMDGLETARRIHREWTTAERPRIIAMTANAMHGDREICLAAGMDDYVSKPVRLDAPAEALGRCRPRAVVDPGALERLGVTPADREFAAELVDALLREAPGLLQTLRGADARRAADTLKSNARVFGATALAELCQELEALAKADHLADTPPSCSVGSTPSTPASSALCRT
jgi:CheY-like chemotaxis protein